MNCMKDGTESSSPQIKLTCCEAQNRGWPDVHGAEKTSSRQHSSQCLLRASTCLDEFHERSSYAVCHENYAGNPLNSYVWMNFTSDHAEIPAWMMLNRVLPLSMRDVIRDNP